MLNPTVSVVVASVGRPDELSACLRSIANQTAKPDEVLVVAQVADLDTREAARELGAAVTVVQEPGLALALQTGIARASCDVVAFVDDDARAHSDWVERIGRAFAANPRLALLGGRDNVGGDAGSGDLKTPVGLLRLGKVVGNHHRGRGAARRVHHVKGANMSMRREVVAGIPLAELVAGSGAQVRNEFVLSLAVRTQGLDVIYDPSIQVDHYPAERAAGDERRTADPERTFVRRSNEAAALSFAGMWMAWTAFALRALLVGDRAAPGLFLSPAKRGALTHVRASLAGVVDGSRRGSRLRRAARNGRVK